MKAETTTALGVRRRVRGLGRDLWFKAFLLFERLGIHVLPKSYYSPVQDYRWLEANKELWIGRCGLSGVEWNVERQIEWVAEICGQYHHEVEGLESYQKSAASEWGPGFGPVESQLLHCFVRSKAPARIIEIGSGQSTVCMQRASEINANEGRTASQITCVEPYPRKALQKLEGVRLLKQLCQEVPRSVFSELRAGDLLFVDSSHAVKAGSDVIRIYLEIIPNLPARVFIHIHDINLPYLYIRSTLSPFFMQNTQETALLAALLTGNQHLSVLASLSALHYDRQRELKSLLPDYDPEENIEGLSSCYPLKGHAPSSIWLETR
ncbi:MAG: class I SAM-dependent methyltransferase [Candidatus Acidiferrales bacterium]